MNVKKNTIGALHAASLDQAYKCGECLHHKRHAHPSMQEVCFKKGIRSFAIAPKCFTADVTQISNNSDSFVQLAALLSEYTPKEKRILLSLLRQKPIKSKKFRKDMPFGTKVYFHGLGKDYANNYLSGYIMGTTSSGELIITGSPDRNTRGKSYFAYMSDTDSLMTYKEWKVKRTALKAAGRMIDPDSLILPKGLSATGEPVTIDSAPAEWHNKEEKRRKRRRSDDLVITISG